jgi:tRNA-dihydrouridine synthase
VASQFQGVIAHLEYVLAKERHLSRDLTDDAVAEALDLLLKTYRTEEKGIIYESVSNNLRVDLVRRHLKEVMDSYRKPSESREEFLQLQDVMDCLSLVRDLVASHLESPTTSSYVDFLARSIPRSSELETPGPSLIVPG